MSMDYSLICMDCNRAVNLGKIVSVFIKDYSIDSYGFSQIGGGYPDGWSAYDHGCSEINQFFMIHLAHEMRVLPDNAEVYASTDFPNGFPVIDEDDTPDPDPRYSRKEFFCQAVTLPDGDEYKQYSEDLIKRIGRVR